MTDKQTNQLDPNSQESLTVDDYMNWVTTLDPLTSEEKLVVLQKAGSVIVEGASPAVLKTHQMVVSATRAECDEDELLVQIKKANYTIYAKNKPAYIFAALAFIVALTVSVYKLTKFISNVL